MSQPVSVQHEPPTDKNLFGFWVYIMSDCVLFASLFAAYAVLHRNTAGGEGAAELFSLPYVLAETMILLTSSFTAGLGLLAARYGSWRRTVFWFSITFLLGAMFLGLEINEFYHLIHEGNGPTRSGFLSAFFTLIGTHGAHITVGLIWLAVLIIRILKTQGLTHYSLYKLTMLSLFWHFLDIIWIFIFSFVFLMGAAA